ncbi:MAG: alpha/beta fold hydrolase [Steroidobacteraceae bacterium]
MPFLTVERSHGRRIYFEHYAGSKVPVVLIHGWGMSNRIWDTTLVELQASGHAVVSFDQRGCGQSDRDFPDVSIAASAADAVAIVRQLGLSKVVLNGWSLGGAVAIEAAHLLGAQCAGIVLTCGATPRYVQASDFPHGGAPEGVAQTVAALRADRANFLHGLNQAVCAVPQTPAMLDWLWSIFMQTSPSADDALLNLGTLEQRAILAALDVPLLSIVGAKDVIVDPEIGRFAAKLAKRGTAVEFPDCGHAPFIEDGPRYRQVLLDFLASIP